MRVGVVAQRGNARAVALAAELEETLSAADAAVAFDPATAGALDREETPVEAMADCDLVVSVGGDGTFLHAARGVGRTPIVGVNLGEVGFLNAVSPNAAVEAVTTAVERARSGDLDVRRVPRLAADGEGWSLPPSINEVVVQGPQRGHGGGVDVEIRIDGSLYNASRADGAMVATPTGSTAYNLSEGGPLVHHGVDGLVVTEMAATESMPSLVVDTAATVTVRVDGAERAHVVGDGRVRETVTPPASVRIGASAEPVCIAGPSVDFFRALEKLE
jgi:NAD+ kinase